MGNTHVRNLFCGFFGFAAGSVIIWIGYTIFRNVIDSNKGETKKQKEKGGGNSQMGRNDQKQENKKSGKEVIISKRIEKEMVGIEDNLVKNQKQKVESEQNSLAHRNNQRNQLRLAEKSKKSVKTEEIQQISTKSQEQKAKNKDILPEKEPKSLVYEKNQGNQRKLAEESGKSVRTAEIQRISTKSQEQNTKNEEERKPNYSTSQKHKNESMQTEEHQKIPKANLHQTTKNAPEECPNEFIQENNQNPVEITETKANHKRTNSEITDEQEINHFASQKKPKLITEEPKTKIQPEDIIVIEELNTKQKKMLETISTVEEEIRTQLEPQVKTFHGISGSKEYFILDEHLLQSLEKLDKLHVKPYPEIREKRKVVIKKIHQLMEELDKNATNDD